MDCNRAGQQWVDWRTDVNNVTNSQLPYHTKIYFVIIKITLNLMMILIFEMLNLSMGKQISTFRWLLVSSPSLSKHFTWTAWYWSWKKYDPPKIQEGFTQRHSITSQKTWIFDNNGVWTSNLSIISSFRPLYGVTCRVENLLIILNTAACNGNKCFIK